MKDKTQKKKKEKTSKMVDNTLVTPLTINDLNTPIKKQSLQSR
jgi:hypothetical protein